MRIKFNKLSVASGQLGVSLNNGESFTKYEINDQLREDGIPLTAEQQFDQIILRGDSKVLRNLEVLQYFKISNKIFCSDIFSIFSKSIENKL